MKWRQEDLRFEERRVSAERTGQDVIVHFVAKVTAEYTEIICNEQRKADEGDVKSMRDSDSVTFVLQLVNNK